MTLVRLPVRSGEVVLTARERQVLVAYANGMRVEAVARTLFLSRDQVIYTKKGIYRKLGVPQLASGNAMACAVARAWRLCLIEADEIEGGPIPRFYLSEAQIHEALLSYRQHSKHLPPPHESWPELRARAHTLAEEYRASKKRRKR